MLLHVLKSIVLLLLLCIPVFASDASPDYTPIFPSITGNMYLGVGLNGMSSTAAVIDIEGQNQNKTDTFGQFQIFTGFSLGYGRSFITLYYQYDNPYKVSFYSFDEGGSFSHVDVLSPAHSFNAGYDYFVHSFLSLGFFGGATWYTSTVAYLSADDFGIRSSTTDLSYTVGVKVEYYPRPFVGVAFKYTYHGSYKPLGFYDMVARSTYTATIRYIL